jgi:hypothetical protein
MHNTSGNGRSARATLCVHPTYTRTRQQQYPNLPFVAGRSAVVEGWLNFGPQSLLLLEDLGGAGFEYRLQGPCDLCGWN